MATFQRATDVPEAPALDGRREICLKWIWVDVKGLMKQAARWDGYWFAGNVSYATQRPRKQGQQACKMNVYKLCYLSARHPSETTINLV